MATRSGQPHSPWLRRLVTLVVAFQVASFTGATVAFADTVSATPTPTVEPSASDTPTPDPSPSETPSETPAPDPTPSDTTTPTPSDTTTPTPTDTATPTPSDTATPSPSGRTTSLIVKFAPGFSASDVTAAIANDGGTESSSIHALGLHVIDVPAADNGAILDAYRADSGVVSADRDRSRDAEAAPSDPSYGDQWSLSQIGWDNAYGSVTPAGTSTIAVLDTGVQSSDVSTIGGWSAFGSDPTNDPNGHGTWMASIAAAQTDNGSGIAGVAYDGVNVMPVQVLDANGTGQDSDIINGVVYATDHGANVVLMSFSNPGYSQALQDAVDYAWSHGVVVVAATGNDGVSTPTYPAGDAKVMGVSATDRSDGLASFSNFGADTFIAAPGVGIAADNAGGEVSTISGTSASAAEVAGAAAFLQANDPSASNAVIVGRLAESTDAAGTSDQTGNGRLNLSRALGDTSSNGVTPVGAPGGGPFEGPYVADAKLNGTIQGQNNPACVSPSPCPWQTTNLNGWSELQTAPLRLDFAGGQAGSTSNTFTISIDHSNGQTAGLESLTNFATSPNVSLAGGIPGGITFSTSSGGDIWNYTFTASISNNLEGFVSFNTRLRAGAHAFSGASLQVKTSGSGTLSFTKPGAAPGTPDLTLTKTALTAVGPGQVLTYTLSYRNLATGTNNATGVQL
ncbi:MAG: thermitase, partial [Actinomycetota bacterium]|nr:thermitase [Actinomycetota bacterium]